MVLINYAWLLTSASTNLELSVMRWLITMKNYNFVTIVIGGCYIDMY